VTVAAEARVERVAVSRLVLGSGQPRKRFDPDAIERLAASLRRRGLLQPIVVRPLGDGTHFEIVAGERRYFAAKAANLHAVPVMVLALSDSETLEVSLVENLQRQNLSEIEETEAILRLLALRLDLEPAAVVSFLYRMENEHKGRAVRRVLDEASSATVLDTFEQLGVMTWLSFVTTRMPLLKLPNDLLEAIYAEEITCAQARVLARVADADRRFALVQEVRERGLGLAELRTRLAVGGTESGLGKTWQSALNQLRARLTLEPDRQARALRLLEELEAVLSEATG
jgi:ParB family transcriptional regulator, chromosome partitioning protein